MQFYVYRELIKDVGAKIVGSIGIEPLGVIPVETRTVILPFASPLDEKQKLALDEFMESRHFIFVRENNNEPLPGWASDPIAPT